VHVLPHSLYNITVEIISIVSGSFRAVLSDSQTIDMAVQEAYKSNPCRWILHSLQLVSSNNYYHISKERHKYYIFLMCQLGSWLSN